MIINPLQGETAMLACKIYNLGNKSVRKVTHSVFLVVILLIHQMQLNPSKCLHVQLSWKWSMETIIISKGSPWWHWTQMCTAGSHPHSSSNNSKEQLEDCKIISVSVILGKVIGRKQHVYGCYPGGQWWRVKRSSQGNTKHQKKNFQSKIWNL